MFFKKKASKAKKMQSTPEISDMIMAYAGGFILDGRDEVECQQRLNYVVSSWNFACLDGGKREAALKKYLVDCKKLNPKFSKKDLRQIADILIQLISEKLKRYPDINVHIFNAKLEEDKGNLFISVASAKI
jgi:hypothetical protein